MQIIQLTSLDHPGLDVYARLTEAQLRRRLEPEQGVFIAESPKVIATALDAGCRPLSLLMERRHLPLFARQLEARCGDVPVYTADREVLARLTGYALTRGMLCAMRRPALPDVEAVCRNSRRVAVLENITDASNVGALFRSAAALGMDAVLVTPSCCDPFYRRAIRVSMGAVFQLPWAWIGQGEGQWPRAGLALLREMGFRTAAMALSGSSISIEEPRLAQAERLAVLLGSEGSGLSPETIACCDDTVRIPMAHGVDSLNVAAAGAVVFWQLRPR